MAPIQDGRLTILANCAACGIAEAVFASYLQDPSARAGELLLLLCAQRDRARPCWRTAGHAHKPPPRGRRIADARQLSLDPWRRYAYGCLAVTQSCAIPPIICGVMVDGQSEDQGDEVCASNHGSCLAIRMARQHAVLEIRT